MYLEIPLPRHIPHIVKGTYLLFTVNLCFYALCALTMKDGRGSNVHKGIYQSSNEWLLLDIKKQKFQLYGKAIFMLKMGVTVGSKDINWNIFLKDKKEEGSRMRIIQNAHLPSLRFWISWLPIRIGFHIQHHNLLPFDPEASLLSKYLLCFFFSFVLYISIAEKKEKSPNLFFSFSSPKKLWSISSCGMSPKIPARTWKQKQSTTAV